MKTEPKERKQAQSYEQDEQTLGDAGCEVTFSLLLLAGIGLILVLIWSASVDLSWTKSSGSCVRGRGATCTAPVGKSRRLVWRSGLIGCSQKRK